MSGIGAPSGRSSGGGGGGSRSFDFGSDDVLCSYDDFAASSEPKRPDPADRVPIRLIRFFLSMCPSGVSGLGSILAIWFGVIFSTIP